jgi:hypothetical protein
MTTTFQENTTDAIRWWERMRLLYNATLAAVVVAVFFATGPASLAYVSAADVFGLFALAVIANVAYCAAYPADLLAQSSAFRSRRRGFRWTLFAIGTAFACVLAVFSSSLLLCA